jgi:tellurite methyltransferase
MGLPSVNGIDRSEKLDFSKEKTLKQEDSKLIPAGPDGMNLGGAMRYDDAYRNCEHWFGREPESILEAYHALLDPARPVLDIGAGQGRHTLYLARRGFTVDAVDPSRVGLDDITRRATAERLTVRTHHCTIDRFQAGAGAYSGVLLFGLIQELPGESLPVLVSKTGRLLHPGGLLFVTAFSTMDPAYQTCAAEWERIGRHSFRNGEGTVRTYLEPDEILELFTRYELIHHREEPGPEHRHGDGPPQRHHRIEFVGRKAPAPRVRRPLPGGR